MADRPHVSDPGLGLPPFWPYIDELTRTLGRLARWWDAYTNLKRGMLQSGMPADFVDATERTRQAMGRRLSRLLREHAVWPFLEPLPGLRGPTTALIMGYVRDPRRFPGQVCEAGHYLPAIYSVGAPCPVKSDVSDDRDGNGAPTVNGRDSEPEFGGAPLADQRPESEGGSGCGAPILPERRGSGVRALYHYFGLHVVNGKAARKRKGQRADFRPRAKALILSPEGGIADQIVRGKVEPYYGLYLASKERLADERGVVELDIDSDCPRGPPRSAVEAVDSGGCSGDWGGRVDGRSDCEGKGGPLRPIEIHRLAQKIAAKRFLAELLLYWKATA